MRSIAKILFNDDGTEKYKIYNNTESLNLMDIWSNNPLIANSLLGRVKNLIIDRNETGVLIPQETITLIMESEFIKNTLNCNDKDTIYILNVNSSFSDFTNAKAFHAANIIINAVPQKGNSSVESFIHELGHLFHYSLTKSMEIIPRLFETLINSNNISNDVFLDAYWNRVMSISGLSNIAKEKFADLYMVACLESDVSDAIPKADIYNKTHHITRKYILDYFKNNVY